MLSLIVVFSAFFTRGASNTLLYETSFELPSFTPGLPIRGQDHWEMYHDGEAISVSTNHPHTGAQCLRFDGALLAQAGPNVSRAYCFTRALDALASNPPPIVEMSAWVRLDGPQIGTDGSPTNDLMSANFYAVGSASGQPVQLGGFIVSSAGRIFADNYHLSAEMTLGVYYQLSLRVDFIARTLRYWVNGALLGEAALTGSADRLLSAYLEMVGPTEPATDPFPYDPTKYTADFDDYKIFSVPLSPVNSVIEFAATSYPYTYFLADEFAATAKVRIVRRGFTNAPVRVTMSTSDATAIAGQDYQTVSTFVTFAAGETEKIVEIPLAPDDDWPEPDKTLTARLTGLPPGATSPQSKATIVIRDDERPGGMDPSWTSDLGLEPMPSNRVRYSDPRLIQRLPDGKMLFDVTVYDSEENRPLFWHLVRLNADGSVDTHFPVMDSYPLNPANALGDRAVTLMPDGSLLVVDYESEPGSDGLMHYLGHRLRYKLYPDGSVDTQFPAITNSTPAGCCGGFTLIAQPDGKILVVGNVSNPTWLAGQRMPWLFRLMSDGRLDSTFHAPPNLVGEVQMLKSGQIFLKTLGDLGKLYRLNSDGSIDSTFSAPSNRSWILPPLLEGLPKGRFLMVGRSASNTQLYRFNENGSPDPDFYVGVAEYLNAFSSYGSIDQVWQLPDGKVLVAGAFRMYNGKMRNSLIRLNANGTLDPTFQTGKGFVGTSLSTTDPGQVQQLFVFPNGQFLVAGIFNLYNGEKVTSPILLNANGTRDPSFEGSLIDAYGGIGPAYSLSQVDPSLVATRLGLGRVRLELPLRIVSASQTASHANYLVANALAGREYTLQSTDDLRLWTDRITQQAQTNRIEFWDTASITPKARAYRVKQVGGLQ